MLKPMWKRLAWRKPPVSEPVPLAFGDRRAEERRIRDHRLPSVREAAAAARDLGQEGGDVERDQDERRRRL